ncbi:MAG: outer membrane protein assembly factor BamA [Candidatus Acidiferrum sp.]
MKWPGANGVRGVLLAALLSTALLARAQAPNQILPAVASAEPNVTEVRLVTSAGTVLPKLPAALPIEVGKPLNRASVAQSLRILFQTGDYSDIRAVTTPAAGGLRLDFVVSESLFFNQVLIEGLVSPPSDASAAAAMQLNLGQPYHRDALDEALSRLREALREEGLYGAEVTAETIPHAETHQMDVIVHVTPGKRARVGTIQLKNSTEYPDADILSHLKITSGQTLTSSRLRRGTESIRKFLVKKNHLSARATARRGAYEPAQNTVALDVEVTEGPRVQVAVTGAKFSSGDLKKLVPIYQEGAIDPDLLEEGKRNLRERLEREGYFDAVVEYTTETRDLSKNAKPRKGTEELITYRVEKGRKHTLVGIQITGNHYFSTESLESRLTIFRGAFASRGRFSRRLVASDAQSMRNLYRANGFLDATADADIDDNNKGREGDLFIRFKVKEGKQTRVASLSIEGNHAFKEEELLAVVGSTQGQPYSEFSVATDRDNILALYFNEGFPDAAFAATADKVPPATVPVEVALPAGSAAAKNKEPDENVSKNAVPQADSVRLAYRIQEGPQTRVRHILLTGQDHTRAGVIRREIQVKPDAPLREGDVVESQRRLYNLGVFNRVTIAPQNPAGTDPDKDVAVLVEEAKRYTVAYGGGFEVQRLASSSDPTVSQVQAAPRGILEVSKLNLTGRADSLSLKVRGSTIEDRALLGYSVPNTFGKKNFSFQANAYTEKTQNISTFTEKRYEGSLQLSDLASPRTTFLYRYVFRKVLVSNINRSISLPQIPLYQQPTLVSQFGMAWVRDTRNNPSDATKGALNSADVGVADTYFGSSASFLRFFYQNSTYTPIRRRFNFARATSFGILAPYRDSVSLNLNTCQPTGSLPRPLPRIIPLPERFFAGGGTSLRGFALNQAGARDSCTGFPLGGQALLALNQEFRFPMRFPFLGAQLGGAIFYDGGNVYSRLNRISLRTSLPRPTFTTTDPAHPQCLTNCTNELNYFAHTIGFGVRYATPVGPIRVDLGYQLNRPFFVVPCTTTTPAPNGVPDCMRATQLPRFQIFFNLGSSF